MSQLYTNQIYHKFVPFVSCNALRRNTLIVINMQARQQIESRTARNTKVSPRATETSIAYTSGTHLYIIYTKTIIVSGLPS